MTNEEIFKYLEEYAAMSPKDESIDYFFARCEICYEMSDCLTVDYLEKGWDKDPSFVLGKMLNKLGVSKSRSFLMAEREMTICNHCLCLYYNGEE
jgi:hypothetical protein